MSDAVKVAQVPSADKYSLLFATIMVAISCIGFGTVPFFAKSLSAAGIQSEIIPFYRYLVSAIVFFPTLFMLKGRLKSILWGFTAGASMGLGWVSYIEALQIVPVSTAGVIYMTYPIFTLLIAWIWLKEQPQAKSILASVIILVAAMITMTEMSLNPDHLYALLLSLLAPIGFGLSINILVNKLNDIPPMSRVCCVGIGSLLGLSFLIGPENFEYIIPTTPDALYLAIGIALCTATIPQLIYSTFAPKIGSAKAAIAGSVELPTMFVVGWLAFGEQITSLQFLSGILVVTAIAMTPTKRVKHKIPK